MTDIEIAILLGFILLLIIGCVILPICLVFMASFLATTKILSYVWAFIAIMVGYIITFCFYFCYCAGFITDFQSCIFPLPISILMAVVIFVATMIYEKAKYGRIFYPYNGD